MSELINTVITSLENCLATPQCRNCPWVSCEDFETEKVTMPRDLATMALRLLRRGYKHSTWIHDRPHHWECGNCGHIVGLSATFQPYCPVCGCFNGMAEPDW